MYAKRPMAVARELAPRDRFARSEKYFNPIREKASCHGHGHTPMANRRLEVVESAEKAGDCDLDDSAVVSAASRTVKARTYNPASRIAAMINSGRHAKFRTVELTTSPATRSGSRPYCSAIT